MRCAVSAGYDRVTRVGLSQAALQRRTLPLRDIRAQQT